MRKVVRSAFTLSTAVLCLMPPTVVGAVKPHGLISDGMVLQQGKSAPVWGTGDNGEKVTVRFQGKEVSATVADGKWMVRLENPAAGGPFPLTIAAGNTIEFKNVLVGEVWVCSGQSNMAWPLSRCTNAEQVIAQSANPMIRLFGVPPTAADAPASDVAGSWQECGPSTVGGFSGVGYFFGRELQKALKVPVGLINSSVGGTPAEAWTGKATLERNPDLADILQDYAKMLEDYPEAMKRYQAAMEKYQKDEAEAKQKGVKPPKKPVPPPGPDNLRRPCGLYNGMIKPLQPYAIRGAIWYQGEGNANRAGQYRVLFPAMIRNWREDWGLGEFPFLFVQLAPFMKISPEPEDSAWAELREAQLFTSQTVPNAGMAVITDVGEEDDIHPKQKEPVGARLALAARALAYGERVPYRGPTYVSMRVQKDRAVLTFKNTGGGLVAKDGVLRGFAIAGADRKFVNANAQIQGDTVIVSSQFVPEPVAVRFGWANYPTVNLWSKDGLPASPFRTDDWVTQAPVKPRPAKPAKKTP